MNPGGTVRGRQFWWGAILESGARPTKYLKTGEYKKGGLRREICVSNLAKCWNIRVSDRTHVGHTMSHMGENLFSADNQQGRLVPVFLNS